MQELELNPKLPTNFSYKLISDQTGQQILFIKHQSRSLLICYVTIMYQPINKFTYWKTLNVSEKNVSEFFSGSAKQVKKLKNASALKLASSYTPKVSPESIKI